MDKNEGYKEGYYYDCGKYGSDKGVYDRQYYICRYYKPENMLILTEEMKLRDKKIIFMREAIKENLKGYLPEIGK